jgi:hypothetical protein
MFKKSAKSEMVTDCLFVSYKKLLKFGKKFYFDGEKGSVPVKARSSLGKLTLSPKESKKLRLLKKSYCGNFFKLRRIS